MQPPVRQCAHCSGDLGQRLGRFCSDRCRKRAFRRRHANPPLPEHARRHGSQRGRMKLADPRSPAEAALLDVMKNVAELRSGAS